MGEVITREGGMKWQRVCLSASKNQSLPVQPDRDGTIPQLYKKAGVKSSGCTGSGIWLHLFLGGRNISTMLKIAEVGEFTLFSSP